MQPLGPGVSGDLEAPVDISVVVHLQLVLTLQIADGIADVGAPHAQIRHKIDVLLQRTGQGGGLGLLHAHVGDLVGGLLVCFGGSRRAHLDLVDAQPVQGAGDLYLVVLGEHHACLLFAVPQRAVRHLDLLCKMILLPDLRQKVGGAQIPVVCAVFQIFIECACHVCFLSAPVSVL